MVHTSPTAAPLSHDNVTIRHAEERDIPQILAILNHQITHSDALWSNTPETIAQRLAWFKQQQRAQFPVIVATAHDAVLAYASYGPFRMREGYAATVEHSVYVAPGATRRGLGRQLVLALIENARAAGYHMMIGAITDTNTASLALHRNLGFEESSPLPQVGRKFDRWLNLVFMYRFLNR